MLTKIGRFFIIIFGVMLVIRSGNGVYRMWKTGERLENAQKKLEEAEARNVELKAMVSEVEKPEVMERMAREKLGYGYEGEVVLVIPDQNTNSNNQNPITNGEEPNWKKWRKLYLGI